MHISNLKYAKELYLNKIRIKKEEKMIKDEIKGLRKVCDQHITLETEDEMKCLICGKKLDISIRDYANNIYVQAALVKDLDQARLEVIDMLIEEPEVTKAEIVNKIKTKYYYK